MLNFGFRQRVLLLCATSDSPDSGCVNRPEATPCRYGDVKIQELTSVFVVVFDDRARELCEGRGGRPGFPVPNKPTVSVDVKQHFNHIFDVAVISFDLLILLFNLFVTVFVVPNISFNLLVLLFNLFVIVFVVPVISINM